MQSETSRSVVVLGAGLAGLRAAREVLEQGHSVEILEKLDEPGGMSRSFQIGEFLFDHGPHGFFSHEEWIVEEFKEITEADGGFHWLTKWSQIHYRGQFFNFPLRVADIASKMNPFTLLASLFSFLAARVRVRLRRREAMSTEEYLVDQFGQVLYQEFFGPYTQKVWDVDPAQLDADFARDRVPSLHLWDVIRKLFTDPAREQKRVGPSGRVVTHDLHTFYYPKRGGGTLPDGYVAQVQDQGGHLRCGVQVDGVDLARRVVTGTEGGDRFELPYEGLVSTIPLDRLIPLIEPAPPAEIRALAEGLRYRGIILVNLCVNRPKVIDSFWIYFTDRFFNRISEYKHFSPDLVPEGKTGICCEVGSHAGDELWNLTDEEIVQRCADDLVQLELLSQDEIEDFAIVRVANAYPIYDVGYEERVGKLLDWLKDEAGITTAGRQGRFLYINQDAAIRSGREAGRDVVELLRTGTARRESKHVSSRPRRKIVT